MSSEMSMCPCYIPLTNITNMINDTCLYCKGSLANMFTATILCCFGHIGVCQSTDLATWPQKSAESGCWLVSKQSVNRPKAYGRVHWARITLQEPIPHFI